jgi:hypothetical protein
MTRTPASTAGPRPAPGLAGRDHIFTERAGDSAQAPRLPGRGDFPCFLNGRPALMRTFTTVIIYNRCRPPEKWSSSGPESTDPVH